MLVATAETMDALSASMTNSSSLSKQIANARKLYNAEATYRASIEIGLRDKDTLDRNLIAYNIPDNEIAYHAGAGTIVPITGFANAVVSPAIEFKTEGFVLGLGANMFKIAGPVIVYGTVASAIYGVVYWITTLF